MGGRLFSSNFIVTKRKLLVARSVLNYLAATKNYYAQWLSVPPELLDQAGNFYLYSSERDQVQEGYHKPFDLYGYLTDLTTIITYGRKFEQDHPSVLKTFNEDSDVFQIKETIKEKTGKNLQHDYKYYFTRLPHIVEIEKARQLTQQEYPDFLLFYQTQYPDSQADSWLVDYFDEIVAKGYVFGIFDDDKLVSVSDSLAMSYLKESAVELGINTLPAYRNRGYAKIVLGAMLRFVFSLSKVPIVSSASSNIASQKLVESIGFVKLADGVSLSL